MRRPCSTSPGARNGSRSIACTAAGGDEWSSGTGQRPCADRPTGMSPACAASAPNAQRPRLLPFGAWPGELLQETDHAVEVGLLIVIHRHVAALRAVQVTSGRQAV